MRASRRSPAGQQASLGVGLTPGPRSHSPPRYDGRAVTAVEVSVVQPIPVVRVAGSHREVGAQLGRAFGELLRREATLTPDRLPAGRSVEEHLRLANLYRAATLRALPWIVEEIDAAAEAAHADPRAVFAASIEEIQRRRPTEGDVREEAEEAEAVEDARATVGRQTTGRCTDVVVMAPATADGHTWIAHTNDEWASSAPDVAAVEWRVPGEPAVFSIGSGPWISVGWNDAGIALSGNELTPNDERIGVPRLLMVREQLTRRSIEDATAAALRSDRASSYNTIFADFRGAMVNIEGSGGDAELTRADERGTLSHTNHYACSRMLRYEGDPTYAIRSGRRLERARELIAEAAARPGSVTPAVLRSILSDHWNAPDSICRHALADRPGSPPPDGEAVATVFWAVSDVTAGRIEFGRGNPCEPGDGQRYAFTTWGAR